YQRKTSFISLKVNVHLKHWDESLDRVKPKVQNAQELNSWILEKQSELEKSWLKEKRSNAKIQVHELKEQIYGKAEIDFFDVAKDGYNAFLKKGRLTPGNAPFPLS